MVTESTKRTGKATPTSGKTMEKEDTVTLTKEQVKELYDVAYKGGYDEGYQDCYNTEKPDFTPIKRAVFSVGCGALGSAFSFVLFGPVGAILGALAGYSKGYDFFNEYTGKE